MRVLITGAGGFAGGHLINYLETQPDLELYGSTFEPPATLTRLADKPIALRQVDLRDAAAVQALVADVRPDLLFHLAALANVPESFKDPWYTISNNVMAQIHVLEAVRKAGIDPRILVVSSAEIYGAAGGTAEPVDENNAFEPGNPYSVSKATQDMLGLQYHVAHGMKIVRARPFNHIGPHQGGGFVAADFATQIAAVEAGTREPVMYVGNLTAERDFTDVRDVVRAYHLMLTQGAPGDVYNVCSGQGYAIQYLLDTLLGFSTAQIEVRQDPARMRPSDVPRRIGDAAKLRNATGWAPTIPFEQSLLDILNDWRRRLGVRPGHDAGANQA